MKLGVLHAAYVLSVIIHSISEILVEVKNSPVLSRCSHRVAPDYLDLVVFALLHLRPHQLAQKDLLLFPPVLPGLP